jgi:hypothetical protein
MAYPLAVTELVAPQWDSSRSSIAGHISAVLDSLYLRLYACLTHCGAVHCPQAQGLCHLVGGKKRLVSAVQQHGILLAAHGPYTAAGAADVLGLPVPVVSKNFSSFHGLVEALGHAL